MDGITITVASTREITPDEHNEILDRTEAVAIDVLDDLEIGEDLVVGAGP